MHPFNAKRFIIPHIKFDRNFDSFDGVPVRRTAPMNIGFGWPKPMRALRVFALALVFVPVLFGAISSAASSIGLVKVADGLATVQRGDATLRAHPGLALQEGDILRTGADGRMGVVLRDDSRLSLGPESEIQISSFVFAPAEGRLALVAKMAHGVLAFVSGRIAKLSPDAVRIETPVAILGVRGTQFLAKVETP